MHRQSSIRLGFLLTLVMGFLASGLVYASHGTKELKTAIEHASLASDADMLGQINAHLQHVVNCLVGEQGEGFDGSTVNPCKGMGQGAINDMHGQDSVISMLEQAAALARIGTQVKSEDAAEEIAEAVEELLEEAQQHSNGS